MAEDRRFRRNERLRLRSEFALVYAEKRVSSDDRLAVYVRENGLGWSRLGLSVGRQVGGAVARNLIRRRIREAFRKNKAMLPKGVDLVCVAKAGPRHTEAEFTESLCALTPRALARPPKRPKPADRSR